MPAYERIVYLPTMKMLLGLLLYQVSLFHRSTSIHFSSCPGGFEEAADFGTNHKRISWSTSVSGGSVTDRSHTSGSWFEFGSHHIVITARSSSNQQVKCKFDIEITDEEIPSITCPPSILISPSSGEKSRQMNFTEATAIDAIDDSPSLQTTYLSGETFYPGETKLSYTFRDDSCNEYTCDFSVELQRCPSNSESFQGYCYMIIHQKKRFWQQETKCIEYDSMVASVHSEEEHNFLKSLAQQYSIDHLYIGYFYDSGQLIWRDGTSVEFTKHSYDFNLRNKQRCVIMQDSFNYEWEEVSCNDKKKAVCKKIADSDPFPTMENCPENVRTTTGSGIHTASVTWNDPQAHFNGSQLPLISSHPSGYAFPIGLTKVNISATNNNEVAYCRFAVIIEDREKPVLHNCQTQDEVFDLQVGHATHIYTTPSPTGTDNSGSVTVSCTSDVCPVHTLGPGQYEVSYEARDDGSICTGPAKCKHNVTIRDVEPPAITCPEDIAQDADVNNNFATIILPNVVATDNVGVEYTWCNGQGWNIIGVTVVNCTAGDVAGNTNTCDYDIIVTDVQAPDVDVCPNDKTEYISPNGPWANVNWLQPAFSDNSGDNPTVTSTHDSGQRFDLGATTVTYTAEDAANNTVTCTFVITLDDNIQPVILNCPYDITTNTILRQAIGHASWEMLNATDNSNILPIVGNSTVIDGQFPIGFTVLTFIATDSRGNTDECQFTVHVEDNEPPFFDSCPNNRSVSCDRGSDRAIIFWDEVIATDNSGEETNIINTHSPGDIFEIGSHQIVYVAEDSSSNSVECIFEMTVIDTEPPVFDGAPGNIEVNTDVGQPSVQVTWPLTNISFDNSQQDPFVNCSYTPGFVFRFGNHSVNCVATDEAGNGVTHTFFIAVIDNEIPAFTSVPDDIEILTDPEEPTAFVEWIVPSAVDNSMEHVIVNSTHLPNTTYPIGLTTVTNWAFDVSGNVNSYSFNITVIDIQEPIFFNLTQNPMVSTELGAPYSHVYWDEASAMDNSGIPPNVTSNFIPGDVFYIGDTYVTYTAVDESGNFAIYTFTVVVEDREPPVFNYCPADITIEAWYRSPFTNVTWRLPNVTDNSGEIVDVECDYIPGDVFDLGTITVVYNASDAVWNFNDCIFNITVIDVEKPYFVNCSMDIYVISIPGGASANASWQIPLAYDSSWITPAVSSTANPGDEFPLFMTLVTYTAIDDSGNIGICQFSITVIDMEGPIFANFTENIEVFIDSFDSNVTVEWNPPYPVDNSGAIPLLESSHSPGDTFTVGLTVVTYNATDESGNSKLFNFTVYIRVAFADLHSLLVNGTGTTDIDILHISAMAVERGDYRELSENEIDTLEKILLTVSSTGQIADKEPAILSKELVIVTSAVVDYSKDISEQIDFVLASDNIMAIVATSRKNTTLKSASRTMASSVEIVENAIWSFHFHDDESALSSNRDNTLKQSNNDNGFLRVDPSSARNVPRTASIIVTYYDIDLFKESVGDAKTDISLPEESEQILPVPYELASGLISCTVATNTSRHSVAVDFAMEISTIDKEDSFYKENAVCGFWDAVKKKWSTSECKRTGVTDASLPVSCRCEHTTTFGIFAPTGKYKNFDLKQLGERILIYILCLVSIISIVYVMRAIHLIWGLFKGSVTVFILSNLLIGSLLLTVVFIISSETIDFPIWCTTFGVLIHFFYMSILIWLVVECIYLYMLQTKFRIDGSISKKASYFIFGWGGAGCIAGIFFGIHYGYGSISGCWLRFETGSLVAFIFPAMVLILIRITLVVLLTSNAITGKKRRDFIKAQIRCCVECTCFLMPPFILTWVFALMVDEKYIFWLIFYMLFALNGLFVALYCYFSHDMRDVRRQDRSLSPTEPEKPPIGYIDTEMCSNAIGGSQSEEENIDLYQRTNEVPEAISEYDLNTDQDINGHSSSSVEDKADEDKADEEHTNELECDDNSEGSQMSSSEEDQSTDDDNDDDDDDDNKDDDDKDDDDRNTYDSDSDNDNNK